MTEIDKIDRVLELIIKAEEPPKRKATEITKELNFEITTKESIEILEKLTIDGYVIREIQEGAIAFYFSSFEGRLFFRNGGYNSKYKSLRRKKRYEKLIAAITITNIVAIIILTFLNYRATDKSNDNKEEVKELKKTIKHLQKSKDSLLNIFLIDSKKKKY